MTSFMDAPYKRPATVRHLSVAFLAGLYYLLRVCASRLGRARSRLKSKSYIYSECGLVDWLCITTW